MLNLLVYIQISLFEKLQFYTVNFTVCSVNVFTVFLYFLHNYSSNHSSQNYFVKTTDFFFYSLGFFCKHLQSQVYNACRFKICSDFKSCSAFQPLLTLDFLFSVLHIRRHFILVHIMEDNGLRCCLVSNILQNIFFLETKEIKSEMNTDLE